MQATTSSAAIPATVGHPAALRFWSAALGTGIVTGLGAGLLTGLLEVVQRFFWRGSGTNILNSAQQVPPARCFLILLGAGLVTGLGQLILKQLSSGNGIDTTAAIWFHAGRLPTWRTLGSAVLSVVVVGMGASLGREGAPKQVGAVAANLLSNWSRLSDEQRRLLVAVGAGAGMAAAYGVPLGGALFALEVMRGALALRYILPALFCSVVATGVAWTMLPNAPTYNIPSYTFSAFAYPTAIVCGLLAGLFSIGYIRCMTWAERTKPKNWGRIILPILGLGLLGLAAIPLPQLLGNGKDVSQLLLAGSLPVGLGLVLMLLKPAAILLCVRVGVPGGLFTPSLTCGALLGLLVGSLCSYIMPGVPLGLCALLGSGAVLSATTQGPLSSTVLLMELTGHDRSFVLPLLLSAVSATLLARSIEPRSIYDARLTDEEIEARQALREKAQAGPDPAKDSPPQ